MDTTAARRAREYGRSGCFRGPRLGRSLPATVNPVLRASDVTDADAEFVADPFLLKREGIWYMYFEVLLREPRRGVIAFASSQDGLAWKYEGIVLDEPVPSFLCASVPSWRLPYTCCWKRLDANCGDRLYRAMCFPDRFQPVCDPVRGTLGGSATSSSSTKGLLVDVRMFHAL